MIWYCKVKSWFSNIDFRATRKEKVIPVRHGMRICGVEHRDIPSAKNISVRAEWVRQSGRGQSELSETSWWRLTPCLALIWRVALHITLLSRIHHFFSLCPSPFLNEYSGVVANCDNSSEWVHWERTCVGIAMGWVTPRKPHFVFLLPARKMQFSLY